MRVLSWSSLNINVFWSLQKDLFKGEWSLSKSYLKQNYCIACCHTRFAVSSFLSRLCCLFYFICHPIITKTIGKEEKKKWRGDLTETIGAYERLGLLELWARAVSHQLKKRRRKVEDGKTYELFSYLLNNLIFSFFLKEERDWELMILLLSSIKSLITLELTRPQLSSRNVCCGSRRWCILHSRF